MFYFKKIFTHNSWNTAFKKYLNLAYILVINRKEKNYLLGIFHQNLAPYVKHQNYLKELLELETYCGIKSSSPWLYSECRKQLFILEQKP